MKILSYSKLSWLILLVILLTGQPHQAAFSQTKILNAGFVCVDGVYNSELMAPYDVFQHTFYRDSTNYIRCFIVTPDGKPFVTFEGIRVTAILLLRVQFCVLEKKLQ